MHGIAEEDVGGTHSTGSVAVKQPGTSVPQAKTKPPKGASTILVHLQGHIFPIAYQCVHTDEHASTKKNVVNFQQWKRPYVYRGVCRNLKRGFRSAAEGSEQSCVVLISPREVRKKIFTVVFQLPGWVLVAPSPLCTALPLVSGFPAIRDRVSLSTWEIMQAVIAHAYTNYKVTVCRLAAPAVGPRGDMLLQEI